VLYKEGSLDIEAINSRHTTGGYVPYRGQEQDLCKLMFSPQFPNNAYRENDWLMQMSRREDQDSSAMPNFNPQSEGGPTNKTLGGAQMMASIGEMKMASLVNQMVIGLKDVAKHHLAIMRNIVEDVFTTSNGEQINKSDLLGAIPVTVKISNVFNYLREGIDSQNRLTQLINFMATKLPQFQAVKLGQFVEDWVRNSLKRENIKDYVDSDLLSKLDEQAALPPPAQVSGAAPVSAPTGILGQPNPPQGGQIA
jgi:hypothetical protein